LRDPRGNSEYLNEWSYLDSRWNKAENLENVPQNIDPRHSYQNGTFVVPVTKFIQGQCFSEFYVSHHRASEGFKKSRFDAIDQDEENHSYEFEVPKNHGDLFFSVESYYEGMVP